MGSPTLNWTIFMAEVELSTINNTLIFKANYFIFCIVFSLEKVQISFPVLINIFGNLLILVKYSYRLKSASHGSSLLKIH